MALVINTNIASLNAQRNLNVSQSALATSLQRLSSGLRINSAKDDAAGLAIAETHERPDQRHERRDAQRQRRAFRWRRPPKARSGISDALQRMRELAVQAANGTNDAAAIANLERRVSAALGAEIDSAVAAAHVQRRRVLDGASGTAISFQVGANVGDTMTSSR